VDGLVSQLWIWGPGGGTRLVHYPGGGMMVEAPHSGAVVRIAGDRPATGAG